jgi:hypothetical protein
VRIRATPPSVTGHPPLASKGGESHCSVSHQILYTTRCSRSFLHHHFYTYYDSTYYDSTYSVLSPFICINSMLANIEPLSLPSKSTFDSFDQLLCYAQTYAKSAGYAFTSKSELRKGRQVRYLNCKRASQERR